MGANQFTTDYYQARNMQEGELPCIYSSDDEGNSYQKVYNEPSEYLVEDIEEYQLETAFEYDEQDNVIDFEPNCIIIN